MADVGFDRFHIKISAYLEVMLSGVAKTKVPCDDAGCNASQIMYQVASVCNKEGEVPHDPCERLHQSLIAVNEQVKEAIKMLSVMCEQVEASNYFIEQRGFLPPQSSISPSAKLLFSNQEAGARGASAGGRDHTLQPSACHDEVFGEEMSFLPPQPSISPSANLLFSNQEAGARGASAGGRDHTLQPSACHDEVFGEEMSFLPPQPSIPTSANLLFSNQGAGARGASAGGRDQALHQPPCYNDMLGESEPNDDIHTENTSVCTPSFDHSDHQLPVDHVPDPYVQQPATLHSASIPLTKHCVNMQRTFGLGGSGDYKPPDQSVDHDSLYNGLLTPGTGDITYECRSLDLPNNVVSWVVGPLGKCSPGDWEPPDTHPSVPLCKPVVTWRTYCSGDWKAPGICSDSCLDLTRHMQPIQASEDFTREDPVFDVTFVRDAAAAGRCSSGFSALPAHFKGWCTDLSVDNPTNRRCPLHFHDEDEVPLHLRTYCTGDWKPPDKRCLALKRHIYKFGAGDWKPPEQLAGRIDDSLSGCVASSHVVRMSMTVV